MEPIDEMQEIQTEWNIYIKNPGEKKSLMTSDFFKLPNKGAHGIKGRYLHLQEKVPIHSHEHYEFEYIVRGEMENNINGVSISMQPGDFYLIGTNDYHEVIPKEGGVVKLSLFFYLPATDVNVRQLLESNRCPIVGTIPEEDRAVFEGLIRQVYSSENYQIFEYTDTVSLSALLALHIAYRSAPYSPDGKKLSSGYMQTALHYILAHYNEPITLQSVSKILNLSPNYFCRLFTTQMKTSFHEYLIDVRIQKAKNLLIFYPKKSITQIALEVGYESYSGFYRCFADNVGLSPKEFRQQNKIQEKIDLLKTI